MAAAAPTVAATDSSLVRMRWLLFKPAVKIADREYGDIVPNRHSGTYSLLLFGSQARHIYTVLNTERTEDTSREPPLLPRVSRASKERLKVEVEVAPRYILMTLHAVTCDCVLYSEVYADPWPQPTPSTNRARSLRPRRLLGPHAAIKPLVHTPDKSVPLVPAVRGTRGHSRSSRSTPLAAVWCVWCVASRMASGLSCHGTRCPSAPRHATRSASRRTCSIQEFAFLASRNSYSFQSLVD